MRHGEGTLTVAGTTFQPRSATAAQAFPPDELMCLDGARLPGQQCHIIVAIVSGQNPFTRCIEQCQLPH